MHLLLKNDHVNYLFRVKMKKEFLHNLFLLMKKALSEDP